MIREIVHIDEEKCDGCGVCVPACHEGAIQVIDGKARLVADRLCDGLGACLGHCPKGAITVERRDAAGFDEQAVAAHLASSKPTTHSARAKQAVSGCPSTGSVGGGCPSARFAQLGAPVSGSRPAVTGPGPANRATELTHWPVQLRLLPPSTPMLQGASLLVAADCAPVAMPDFHARLLRGHAVAIGCPKFDDLHGYVEKLTEMIRLNDLAEVVVAHMEVPCCTGLLHAVLQARRLSGASVPVVDVVISTRGEVLSRREVPVEE